MIIKTHSGIGRLRGGAQYASTGKADFYGGGEAYWVLSEKVEAHYGDSGGSLSDIHNDITGPLGLAPDDTLALVKAAVREGYLKRI